MKKTAPLDPPQKFLIKIHKEKFLKLPAGEIRRMIDQNKSPHTGIFVADGNRRLVMTQTGLTPDSEDFYPAYVNIVTEAFRNNLEVFFQHGLHTLLFPLFGPSLLTRTEKYRGYVMPELVRRLFKSDGWLSFYREQGVRIKAYGNLETLHRQCKDANLAETIKECEHMTSAYGNHRLFYGFFSTQAFDRVLIQQLHRFLRDRHREPDPSELAHLYYREPLRTADFFITSTRMGYLGALPPFAYGKNTRMYTLAAPGVFALNENTYRQILYDLLCLGPADSGPVLNDTLPADIDSLARFYQRHQNRVMGTGEKIGKWRVLDDSL